jgi:2-isopropylmalate synthase
MPRGQLTVLDKSTQKMLVQIYDTTLRDGTQREGISLSLQDKIRITRILDDLGVAYIEGGWPGSNPKDAAYFEAARDLPLRHARIAAFGSTCRVGSTPADDENIKALVDSQAPVVTVVGKSWLLHVHEVLRTTPQENLRLIQESVAYLKGLGREVIYDAEHFFDGYKADSEYAIETLRAAYIGGADCITLCDTNGGSMYWEVEKMACDVLTALPAGVRLGIHTHNDGEQGVANSLAAVRSGATLVQGTINGYGERCGNANLCSIIPDLLLKMGISCLPNADQLRDLTHVSRTVAEIANLPPDNHLAYVGRSAFAHKGGIHVAAMRRTVESYQHIDPALVGNEMRVLISDLSGRGNVLSKAEQFGMDVTSDAAVQLLDEIKRLENLGYAFEGAEGSIGMMMKRAQPGYRPPFELIDFMVVVENRQGRGMFSEATVKLAVGDERIHTAAEGNGPVNALDIAMRKALAPIFPRINEFHLADYKVRILDGHNGSAAFTRVLIDSQDGETRWSTVGAGTNIIEASWRALVDSYEYGLVMVTQP